MMNEETICEEIRLKFTNETWNYFIEEISQNKMISKKHKKSCLYWTLAFLVSTVTGCDSISAFAALVVIPVGSTSSAVGLKICVITARIKKYK